ncbi:hypothetical protein SLA2020_255650 [Shorea laevis]
MNGDAERGSVIGDEGSAGGMMTRSIGHIYSSMVKLRDWPCIVIGEQLLLLCCPYVNKVINGSWVGHGRVFLQKLHDYFEFAPKLLQLYDFKNISL